MESQGRNVKKNKRLYLAILVGLAVATAGGLAAFQAMNAADDLTLKIQTSSDVVTFQVELADEFEEQRVGLMHRPSLPDMTGMVFTYPEPVSTAFWMKNTFIPLDMIWIDETGTIVGITKDVRPMSLTPRPSPSPVVAVLEIEGGTSDRLGIQVGDTILQVPGLNLPSETSILELSWRIRRVVSSSRLGA